MNFKPHAIREQDAAKYLGVGRTKFRELVKEGQLPPAYWLGGVKVWITTELERSFDHLIGAANDNSPTNQMDSWHDVVAPQTDFEMGDSDD